jgi:hypothetical protein
MPSNVKPPNPRREVTTGIERPEDEVVWMKCRGAASCEGNDAKVILRKNDGIHGTWIQYQCLTCNRPFSVRF